MLNELRHTVSRSTARVTGYFADLKAFKQFQAQQGITDRELASVSDWMVSMANGYVQRSPAANTVIGKEQSTGYDLLDEYLKKDPHLASVHETRVMALLSKDYVVEAGGEDALDIEAAEFVRWNLETMEGTVFEVFEALMDCVAKGFSISEEVWELVEEGEWAGKYRLRAIKDKNQKNVRFRTDRYGNLDPDRGVQYIDRLGGVTSEFTPEKFLVVSYRKRKGNWYGNGLVSDVAWYIMFKRVAMRSWNILLQRFGNPAILGRYPANATQGEIEELKSICKNFAEQMSVTFPDGPEGDRFVVELLESKQQGAVGYQNFLQYCDFAISKRYVGSTLTSEAGDRGARSLGEVHEGIMELRARFDGLLVSDRFSEQSVKRMTLFNFPPGVKTPRFYWKFTDPVDVKTLADGFKVAQELGLDLDAEDVAERLQVKVADTPEKVLKKAPQVPFAEGAGFPANPSLPQPEYWRELNEFEQFADVPRLKSITSQLIDAGVALGVPAMQKVIESLLVTVERKFVKGGKMRAANVGRLSVNVAPLRKVLYDTLVTSWAYGAESATRNMESVGYRFKPSKFAKFADTEFAEPREIITAYQSTVNSFKGRLPVDREQFDAMSEYMKAKSFTMAGMTQATIQNTVMPIINDAVAAGSTFKDVEQSIWDAMLTYTGTVKGTKIIAGELVDAAHLQTVFRNNVMSALNTGRMTIFMDPDVQAFSSSLMFSAIMDDRTSPICQSWDGRVFLATDPIWGSITPPTHHNCRSTVIPAPGAALSKKDGTLKPQKGFGGYEYDASLDPGASKVAAIPKVKETPKPVVVPPIETKANEALKLVSKFSDDNKDTIAAYRLAINEMDDFKKLPKPSPKNDPAEVVEAYRKQAHRLPHNLEQARDALLRKIEDSEIDYDIEDLLDFSSEKQIVFEVEGFKDEWVLRRAKEKADRYFGRIMPDTPVNLKRITDVERAFYDHESNSIGLSINDGPETLIHELGHWVERHNPEAHEKILSFLKRRTRGELSVPLGYPYASNEMAYRDKFINHYMGKVYKDESSTEILSMGIEAFFRSPAQFMIEDPDYAQFIIDLLEDI